MALSKICTKRIGVIGTSSKSLLNYRYIQQRSVVTKIKEISEFEGFVNNSVKLLVIDYKADWCGPCKLRIFLFALA